MSSPGHRLRSVRHGRNPMTVALVWAHMHTLRSRRASRPGALISVLAILSSRASPPAAPLRRRRPRQRRATPPASLAPGQDPERSGRRRPAGTQRRIRRSSTRCGRIVVPKPGQLDVRPIPATDALGDASAGRHVDADDRLHQRRRALQHPRFDRRRGGRRRQDVRASPCARDTARRTSMCIEIAESKRAIVDLGDLGAGHVHDQRQRPAERHRSRHRRLTSPLSLRTGDGPDRAAASRRPVRRSGA